MSEKSVDWAGSSAHLGLSQTWWLTGWKLSSDGFSWGDNSLLHVTVTLQLATLGCLHMVISAQRGGSMPDSEAWIQHTLDISFCPPNMWQCQPRFMGRTRTARPWEELKAGGRDAGRPNRCFCIPSSTELGESAHLLLYK